MTTMNPKVYLISKEIEYEVRNQLEKLFGIPEVTRNLAVYFKKEGNEAEEVHVRFNNRDCVMTYVRQQVDELLKPKVFLLPNKTGVKSVFTFFKNLGFNKATVGDALNYNYHSSGETNDIVIQVVADTFIGTIINIFQFPESTVVQGKVKKTEEYLESLKVPLLTATDIGKRVEKAQLKDEIILDDLGVINEKIYTYCRDVGLEVSLPDNSLKTRISHFNNDYSKGEKAFEFIFDHQLLSYEPSKGKEKFFTSASIIIPCFNSGKTYLKTLASIDAQELPESKFNQIEVILVDDGSNESVESVIRKDKPTYKFSYQVVRIENNAGLSTARNIGINLASHEMIVFLDSDVVLCKNYLVEHSIRNQLIPNAIFVSFKQNLDPKDEKLSFTNIAKGLPVPDISRDMRVKKIIEGDSAGLYSLVGRQAVEILGDTNYFKSLSYGRNVGLFDLPSMVIGHNMSVRKENINKIGGFSTAFKGWGLEDSYFGAKMIAEGNFVIPVLCCGVYHIDHPPRSGSDEKKREELKRNLAIYQRFLESPYSFE